MTTFARITIALVATAGVASAQSASKPAPPPAPPAKPAAMPEMKPAKEIADHAKMVSGTWKCTGETADPAAGKMMPMTGKLKIESSLDGWWLHTSFESKMGKEIYKFESYDTVDGKTKRWKRVMVSTYGGWNTGEATMANNKLDWQLAAHGEMGDFGFREHEDYSDPKAGAKMAGELSMDGGKSWVPMFTMTCKK